jgi:hypothetical protein
MTEPKSHSKEDIYEFLMYCSTNDQIEVWNNWRDLNREVHIDLSSFNLNGANLSGANLIGAILIGANLNGADLFNANLIGAIGYKSASDSSIATKEIELKQRIEELEMQQANLATQTEEDKKELEKLKKEQTTLTDGKTKKDEILKFISTEPSKSLGDIKTMLENRIKWFNSIGMVGMIVSVSVFLVYLACLFCELPLPDNVAKYAM